MGPLDRLKMFMSSLKIVQAHISVRISRKIQSDIKCPKILRVFGKYTILLPLAIIQKCRVISLRALGSGPTNNSNPSTRRLHPESMPSYIPSSL